MRILSKQGLTAKCLKLFCLGALAFSVHAVTEAADKISSFYGECGKIKVRYDSRKAWNLNRIEYEGNRICMDNTPSHYGTVFRFRFGFIGSGHTENETEQVKSLKVWIDGTEKPFDTITQNQLLKAETELKTERVSTIRDFTITDTTIIKNNLIKETVIIDCHKDTKLSMVYNFMSPWVPQMTDYYSVGVDEKVYAGEFNNNRKFKIQKDVKWAALYNRDIQYGAVMVINEAKQNVGKKCFFFWDKGNYKKAYFRCLAGAKMPAGDKAEYTLTRGFFFSTPEQWTKTATDKATAILENSE